jgi:hypothetical protein
MKKNFKEKDNEILGTNIILKAKEPLPYLPSTVFDEKDEILDLPYYILTPEGKEKNVESKTKN